VENDGQIPDKRLYFIQYSHIALQMGLVSTKLSLVPPLEPVAAKATHIAEMTR
jgi:hypothetical protein